MARFASLLSNFKKNDPRSPEAHMKFCFSNLVVFSNSGFVSGFQNPSPLSSPETFFQPFFSLFLLSPSWRRRKEKEEGLTRRAGDKWRGESSLNPPGGIPESTPKPQLSAATTFKTRGGGGGGKTHQLLNSLPSRLEGGEIAKCRRIVRIFFIGASFVGDFCTGEKDVGPRV